MFTKLVTRPKYIIDTDKVKTGMKIYYAERNIFTSYDPDNPDGVDDNWDDSGYGEITFVCEEYLTIRYNRYNSDTPKTITVNDFIDGDIGTFTKLEILE